MDYDEMCKTLNSPKASKEQLRSALAFSLGIEYISATKEKKESIFNDCKALFFKFYKDETGLIYTFTGRDGKALTELIRKIKTIFNYPVDDSQIPDAFRLLLDKLPDWYKKNAFSLPVINSKFNEIVSSISKNEKGQSNISNSYKQKLIDDLQS